MSRPNPPSQENLRYVKGGRTQRASSASRWGEDIDNRSTALRADHTNAAATTIQNYWRRHCAWERDRILSQRGLASRT